MSSEVANSLGANCPKGGSFYICYDKPDRFLGCCTIDPCKTDDGVCPEDNLRYTSFSTYSYNQITSPQECANPDPHVRFFACAEIKVPFMGCCTGDPCNSQGCAQQNMSAAILSDKADIAAPFMPKSDKKQGLTAGEKAGIGVGVGLGVVAILTIFAFFYLRMRNKTKSAAAAAAASSFDPQHASEKTASQSQYGSKADGSVISPYTSVYAPSVNPHGSYDPNQQHQNNAFLNVQQWQYRQSQASQQSPETSQGGFAPSNISSTISPPPQSSQPYSGPQFSSHPVEMPNDFVTAREGTVEKPPAEIGDTGK